LSIIFIYLSIIITSDVRKRDKTSQKKVQDIFLISKQIGVWRKFIVCLAKTRYSKGQIDSGENKKWREVCLRNKFYDTAIFSQIFIYEELNFDLPSEPKTILDCGANTGLATLYFKFKYPQTKIISVEPEQSNFTLLKKIPALMLTFNLSKKGYGTGPAICIL